MGYDQYIQIINRLSYERYEHFEHLDEDADVYPIMTPIGQDAFWKIDIEKMREKDLGETFPLLQRSKKFIDAFDCIETISYYTNAILRIEPQNTYFFHCAVPSAKGIHPCECYYMVKINHSVQLLRFNTASCGMEAITRNLDPQIVENMIGRTIEAYDVIVIVASDMFRLAKYYGSFAFILSALDAGHILSQLGMVAARGADSVTTYYDIDTSELVNMLMVNQIEIHPEAVLHICLDNDCSEVKIAKQIDAKERPSIFLDRIKKLEPIVMINQLIAEHHVTNQKYEKMRRNSYRVEKKELVVTKNYDFNKTIMNRTSAQSVLGTFSLKSNIGKEEFQNITKEICSYMEGIGLGKKVNVYCYVNQVDGYAQGFYQIVDGQAKELRLGVANMRMFLHDSHDFFTIESMPVVLFFSCNVKDYYNEYEMNALKTVYINSGEACQGTSLSFCKYGYFARPLKNLKEEYVEECLQLQSDERITYMLVIGMINISSIDLEVI